MELLNMNVMVMLHANVHLVDPELGIVQFSLALAPGNRIASKRPTRIDGEMTKLNTGKPERLTLLSRSHAEG